MIKEKAYAKINLALEVKNIMNDGYHEINNIMIPVDLYDELIFEESPNIELINNDIDNNIIIKAAKLILSNSKIDKGVKITINKKIPIAAGLGGGSSDAARTLVGINKLYNLKYTLKDLIKMAEQLGSDVPFFINNKLSYCYNRGEKIKLLDFNYNKFDILLIITNITIQNKTKEVYANYQYDNKDKSLYINNILKGLETNNIELIKQNIFNDLTLASLKTSKELNNIYNDLKTKYDIHLSGAGPTLFIVNPTNKEIEEISKYKNVKTIKTSIL